MKFRPPPIILNRPLGSPLSPGHHSLLIDRSKKSFKLKAVVQNNKSPYNTATLK
jgi:hypothetical protein